jgi:hypothetical protein
MFLLYHIKELPLVILAGCACAILSIENLENDLLNSFNGGFYFQMKGARGKGEGRDARPVRMTDADTACSRMLN